MGAHLSFETLSGGLIGHNDHGGSHDSGTPGYLEKALHDLENTPIETDLKLTIVRGIPQNPTFDAKKFEDIIDNFETRDGDVFVATYVKAGTTWTQQIVHQLLGKGEAEGFYGKSVPWLECAASEFLTPREMPGLDLEKINAMPSPRYWKTHATVRDLPRGKGKIKVIYVARNPKDTLVSLYHHAKSKPEFEFTGDFNTFFNIFLAGKAENASWFDHVLNWHKECLANPETHLFLQYEDMYQDTPKAVKTIADFLGIPTTPEIIEKVVKKSSIAEMRQTSSIGLNHLRQGGYGNWRSMFTVQQNEFFDDVYRHKMKNSNLKFNFGPNSHGVDVIM